VRYVLAGSVRRLGSRFHVNVQLSDTDAGALVWADRFDADGSDVTIAHDQIVTRLARALWLKLVEAEARRADPANLAADDFVMRGWVAYQRVVSEETLLEAQQCFERALELDPHSHEARIGLASVLILFVANARNHIVGGIAITAEEDLARSDQLLHEAVQQDANNGRLIYTMGWLRTMQNRLIDAKILLEKAIDRDRNSTQAYHLLGITLVRLGEPELALSYFDRRMQLDPESGNTHMAMWWCGYANRLLGRTDLAVDLYSRARAANPRDATYQLLIAAAFALNGNLAEARAALTEALKLKPAIDSIAKLRALPGMKIGTPRYFGLVDRTVNVGLRCAGMTRRMTGRTSVDHPIQPVCSIAGEDRFGQKGPNGG
jgi:adenylate cyclase